MGAAETTDSFSVRIAPPDGLSLRIDPQRPEDRAYPSGRIRKGLCLIFRDTAMSEEGVGFGLPVLKRPGETYFPGSMRLLREPGDPGRIAVEYSLDLVERVAWNGRRPPWGRALDAAKEVMARLHRGYPFLRAPLTALSNALRAGLGFQTAFQPAASFGIVRMEFRVDAARGRILVHMDARGLRPDGRAQIVLMNEHGARFFGSYWDSDGISLSGASIKTWREVSAEEAGFHDPRRGIVFRMKAVRGARLFRGRELVEGRLAWAGLAYLLPAGVVDFGYEIYLEARP